MKVTVCSQSKFALLHGFMLLKHVGWLTLFSHGDSILLLFPLKNKWNTTWHVCSGTYFVAINCIYLHDFILLNPVGWITLFLPRGQYTPIIPFAKTNGPQPGMSVHKLTLLLLTVFLCKYKKVLWLCKSKGFHNFLMRVILLMTSYYFFKTKSFSWHTPMERLKDLIDKLALLNEEKTSQLKSISVSVKDALLWFPIISRGLTVVPGIL